MEKHYRSIRISQGDYIQPSNDGKTLWRVFTYGEDGSLEGWKGTFWATAKYDRPFHNNGEWMDEDFLEWSSWLHWAGPYRTKREAVEDALRVRASAV